MRVFIRAEYAGSPLSLQIGLAFSLRQSLDGITQHGARHRLVVLLQEPLRAGGMALADFRIQPTALCIRSSRSSFNISAMARASS
jgi:hypothetical protein